MQLKEEIVSAHGQLQRLCVQLQARKEEEVLGGRPQQKKRRRRRHSDDSAVNSNHESNSSCCSSSYAEEDEGGRAAGSRSTPGLTAMLREVVSELRQLLSEYLSEGKTRSRRRKQKMKKAVSSSGRSSSAESAVVMDEEEDDDDPEVEEDVVLDDGTNEGLERIQIRVRRAEADLVSKEDEINDLQTRVSDCVRISNTDC